MDDFTRQSRQANQASLAAARSALPEQPLLATATVEPTTLTQFEVVLAYNLDQPYRWSQEFYWLEVLADSELAAVRTASEWTTRAPGDFEPTDYVRRSSPHERSLGLNHEGQPLPVNWNQPIDEDLPPNWMIRDPNNGFRIGFLARPEAEARWLAPEGRDRYRLIMRKPVVDTEPVCLAPIVKNTGPVKAVGL